MNRQPPELDPRLVALLEAGPSTGPQVVLSNAFARARSMDQDRPWLHRRPTLTRFQIMTATITLAAFTVLAFGVGVALAPRGPDIAAPAPSESPAPTPAPLSQMWRAGTYTVTPFAGAEWAPCGPIEDDPCLEAPLDDDLRFTFTVPEGWAGAPFGNDIWLASDHNSSPAGAGFLIGRGGWMYSEPCGDADDPDTSIGPTVDDFVDALADHPHLDATDQIGVTVGGYPAKYLEIQGPADRTDCMYFQAWSPTFYAQGDNNHQPIWVVDVDGVRVVIHGSEFPGTDPKRSAELRAIVESMRIERDPALAPPSVVAQCPNLLSGPNLLEPGRYVMTGGRGDCDGPPYGWPDKMISVEVPEGWTHFGPGKAGRLDHDRARGNPDARIQLGDVASMTADLCGAPASLGPTVDDLVKALEAIDCPGVAVTQAQDMTLGGYEGKRIEVTVPTGDSLMQTNSQNNGVWRFPSGPGWTQRIWILDVDGVRLVVDEMRAPDASLEVRSEAEDIVRSIEFSADAPVVSSDS